MFVHTAGILWIFPMQWIKYVCMCACMCLSNYLSIYEEMFKLTPSNYFLLPVIIKVFGVTRSQVCIEHLWVILKLKVEKSKVPNNHLLLDVIIERGFQCQPVKLWWKQWWKIMVAIQNIVDIFSKGFTFVVRGLDTNGCVYICTKCWWKFVKLLSDTWLLQLVMLLVFFCPEI